eukprot:m.144012 g.144012  ORF g.144012 m.144012 type:complete len:61 (+) comp23011_c1_seq1:131-313(+)
MGEGRSTQQQGGCSLGKDTTVCGLGKEGQNKEARRDTAQLLSVFQHIVTLAWAKGRQKGN